MRQIRLTAQTMAQLMAVRRQQLNAGRLRDALFPKQRDVYRALEDGKRRIAVRCSRRSGKSYLSNTLLATRCEERPGSLCLHLALTHDNVLRIAWSTIKKLKAKYALDVRLKEAFLRAAFANGSMIVLFGSSDPAAGTERLVVLAETRESGHRERQQLREANCRSRQGPGRAC